MNTLELIELLLSIFGYSSAAAYAWLLVVRCRAPTEKDDTYYTSLGKAFVTTCVLLVGLFLTFWAKAIYIEYFGV